MDGGTGLIRAPGDRLSVVARSIKPSGIRRFFDLVSQTDDVISLGIGEPDLQAPMEVRMVGITALVDGNTRYSPNAGLLTLRESIADYLHRRFAVTCDPLREILVTVGVAEGVDIALRALLNPGDEVLIPEPCFVSYAPCTELAGGRPVPIPLSAATGFHLTPEALEPYLTDRSRVLLLNYPNNPTGAALDEKELAALVPLIEQYDLTVISDEIYSELTFDKVHVSLASLPGMRDRVVLLNGFSKTFSMTGWRLGYAAGPQPIIEGMTRIHQHTLMCAPTVAQLAAVKALGMVDTVVDQARTVYRKRRDLLCGELKRLGLSVHMPEGSFFAFPDITATGMTDETFADELLREEKVAVVPGSAFGQAGAGHVRCSFATETEQIEKALERIARFVQRHRYI